MLDKNIADRIFGMLTVMFADNVKARELTSKGGYIAPAADGMEPVNSQERFLKGKFSL